MPYKSLKKGEKILFGIAGIFIIMALIGYIVLEAVRIGSDKPMFESKTHYNLSEEGKEGSAIFRHARCTSCHRALRNGTNMGLNLDGIGSKRTREWLFSFLKHPEETYSFETLDHGDTPKEASYVSAMSDDDLGKLSIFLSQLISDQGSASSPLPPEGRSDFIDSMVEAWAPRGWKEKYGDVRDQSQSTREEE